MAALPKRMSHPVADYLNELYLISGVSVPETSGYPALSKLLNAVCESLKPKITAVIHPSNNGVGKGLGELAVKEGSAGTPARIETIGGEGAKNKKADKSVRAPLKAKASLTPDLDIHLNVTTRWKDVPEPVWNYTLGGYQVLKKWLSYRESALLGRPLTSDEAQSFTHHVRRITAILELHEALDAHYGASV